MNSKSAASARELNDHLRNLGIDIVTVGVGAKNGADSLVIYAPKKHAQFPATWQGLDVEFKKSSFPKPAKSLPHG